MAKIRITLNGTQVEADTCETILEVARRNKIFIPTLCHDERLEPIGSCRVCLVKVEGSRCFLPSCTTKVTEGMRIDTEDEGVREARKLSLTLLISDHFGDCVSPCSLKCPAHIDIQGYIALVRAGKYQQAVKLIKERNPLPLTIGRVCPHPCETVCRRSRVDEAIAINNLKRFAADYDRSAELPFVPSIEKKKNKKIAVVGAGPAGLSCAYYLAVKGYDVSIFEMHQEAGGMLRWGIPDYRLPKDVLEKEIKLIRDLGVGIQFGREFGKDVTLESVKKQGFSALFLGIGAQKSIGIRIEGENDPHVLVGIQFLHDMAKGRKFDFAGKTVVVVGGGNTAMDASRTSLRLGSAEVRVLYRRSRREMPANDIEIEEAEEEGVVFEYLAAPVRITPADGGLDVECIRMELGKPDASGRRRPVPIEGSNYTLRTHYLISAIGQRTDVSSIADPEMVSAYDTIKANPNTGTTHDDFVFAGGDCVTGAATAIEAIAGGRKAAFAIDEYLRTGKKPEGETWEFNISKGTLEEIPDSYFELYEKAQRAVMPVENAMERIEDFREIERGLSEEEAIREAARCLECGCSEGFSCLLRDYSTRYRVDTSEIVGEKNLYQEQGNLISGHPPILRDENKCIKCGICVRICDEVWGLNIFGYTKRGFQTEISPSFGLELKDTECDFCGQCAGACPTGALSLNCALPKPGPFKSEKVWARCINCSLGCELEYDVYENMVLGTSSEPMRGENQGNLCVRGRFGFGHLLSPSRNLSFLECNDGTGVEIGREKAIQNAATLLKNAERPLILTSTHLSNEEYERVRELSDLVPRCQLFHIPFDFADYPPRTLPVAGKSLVLESLIKDIPSPSLSQIASGKTVVLFNIKPGRSYPILEMTLRKAAKAGAKLFVIQETPTRLDDYAESIFRIREAHYLEFLKTAGALALRGNPGADAKTRKYYSGAHPKPDFFPENGINAKKLESFLKCITGSSQVLFITDEDMTALDELEAFIHLLRVSNRSGMLMMMQRGTNPKGALNRMQNAPKRFTLDTAAMSDYDALLLYKLPDLFGGLKKKLIHIGFVPFPHYGKPALFVPSSSLLETGGTIHLYNGRSVILPRVLKVYRDIENTRFIKDVAERLNHV